MTREEKLALLQQWQKVYNELDAATEQAHAFGMRPESPLIEQSWKAFELATKHLSARLGDPGIDTYYTNLEWYLWECQMGKRPLNYKIDGKMHTVRDLESLLDVIEGQEAKEEL